jgi:hypothetical protein
LSASEDHLSARGERDEESRFFVRILGDLLELKLADGEQADWFHNPWARHSPT